VRLLATLDLRIVTRLVLATAVLRVLGIRVGLLGLGTIAICGAMLATFDLRVLIGLVLAFVIRCICHCNYSWMPALLISRKRNA
jgi:hypothetical protein